MSATPKKTARLMIAATLLLVWLCPNAMAADEHEKAGLKYKITEVNRTETEADLQFRKGMHMTYLADGSVPYGSGSYLYRTLTVTGDGIGERQVYSVRDIEELASISMTNTQMASLSLTVAATYELAARPAGDARRMRLVGLDLLRFLSLCGVSDKTGSDIYLRFYAQAEQDEPALSMTLRQLQEAAGSHAASPAILAFGLYGNKPLVAAPEDACYSPCCQNSGGPLRLVIPQSGKEALCVDGIQKILVSKTAAGTDPRYDLHNRAPFAESAQKTFTVNLYDRARAGSGPIKTKVFTTAELEQLALDHPERVRGNYYGLIGDSHSMNSMGLGGWLDYFEGLDLRWLLESQVGLPSVKGKALLYGRDGVEYAAIEDLAYFNNPSGDYSRYTITTKEGCHIPNAVPMLAFAKNGYPLLPEHDHESSAYHAYNQMNQALAAAGVATEVGVIKNHNGPFVACLGNVDGLYGGYQKETGGDCVRIDLYLDLPPEFAGIE